MNKNESYLTKWHTRGFQNIKLVFHYSKSVSHENSKCLHFPSVLMKHIVQNKPFLFSSQTKWQNESYLTQWHTKGFQNIKSVSLYSKSVSCENFKCLHFAWVQEKPTAQNRQFSSPIEKNKRWAIFDTIGYQRLLEYQIGLPLLKVNEPRKFKMLSFCISTGEYGPFSTMCFTLYWCKKKHLEFLWLINFR